MTGVDTNILARFYVDDPADPEAPRQRLSARQGMGATSIFVPAIRGRTPGCGREFTGGGG